MGLVADGVEGAIIGTALYEGRFTLHRGAGADAGCRAMSLAVRVIPCLDVDGGRVVKGVNFASCATPATRSSWPRSTTREGADELTFLDISASHEGRATTLEIVCRTAEQVFIPLTVGGGISARRRRPAAARRRRQDRGQHRRDPPARAGRRDRRPVRQPGAGPSARRPPRRAATRASGFEVTTHGGRKSAGLDAIEWAGRPRAGRRRDPAQRDGRRRHAGRLRPRPDPRRTPRGQRPGDRQRGRRARPRTSRRPSTPARTPCWPPASSTSARCHRRGQGGAWRAAGHPVR